MREDVYKFWEVFDFEHKTELINSIWHETVERIEKQNRSLISFYAKRLKFKIRRKLSEYQVKYGEQTVFVGTKFLKASGNLSLTN